ncbi:unnamed protein product, partial [Prorocentrum cordatum]
MVPARCCPIQLGGRVSAPNGSFLSWWQEEEEEKEGGGVKHRSPRAVLPTPLCDGRPRPAGAPAASACLARAAAAAALGALGAFFGPSAHEPPASWSALLLASLGRVHFSFGEDRRRA